MVDEDHAWHERPGLDLVHLGVGDDDRDLARLDQEGGRPVDTDLPASCLTFDDVGRQPVAVGDVDDGHLFTGKQPGSLEESPVDRHRADVVEICLRDRHAVELGVEHGAQHSDVLQLRGVWGPADPMGLDGPSSLPAPSEKISSAPPPGPTLTGTLSIKRVVPTRPATASRASPRYHSGTSSSVEGCTSTR